MQITLKWLKKHEACEDGISWFRTTFPKEAADCQDVLNALAEGDLPTWAEWLMEVAGPLPSRITCNGSYLYKNIFAAGNLTIRGEVRIPGRVLAGGNINASDSLFVGHGIRAEGHIKAVGYLQTEANSIDARGPGGIRAGGAIWSGWHISSSGDIVSGGGIVAGASVLAAGKIRANKKYGIYAGLRWPIVPEGSAGRVFAAVCPKNLLAGKYYGALPGGGGEDPE